ncbi:MAG TPA: hypothetical protein VJ798_05595 [Rhizomicrobium sp.]|nr:hypothetical protein [Rhizomicrobium sp.]
MKSAVRVTVACAILAAFAAGPSHAAPELVSSAVTSFGASRSLTGDDLATITERLSTLENSALVPPGSFASSTALSGNLALDTGYRLDLSSRLRSFNGGASPLLPDGSSFLALANAGRYGGVTYVPRPDLKFRLGASAWNGRLDNVSFDPVGATGLPVAFDRGSVTSVVAGLSWSASEWASLGVNAISSVRRNTPLGYSAVAPLGQTATTNAVEVTASLNLPDNWVTTTHFSQGFTQLNQRTGLENFDSQAYAITVAKHGVFGDDAVAFSLSRPAPGMIGSFSAFSSAGDLPPIMLPGSRTGERETKFQLGYVTSFMGGRLALQANAGYQMNLQGQSGVSAVSVLSSAKFKF